MRRGWRVLSIAAVFLVFGAACTSSSSVANVSPETSPSASASPSPSPSASPSSQPTATPSTAPSPSGGGLAITSLPFHNGEVGIGYLAVTLGASGGTGPYSWSTSGAFPPGLALSSDGTVTGTNTQAGQFSFTVKVVDSTGATATSPSGFGVFPALSASQPCANQCTVGAGCAKCGGFGTINGGLGPFTFKVVGGYVPSGMTLSGLTLKGAFPQSPLGAYNLSVQVTDQFTATATVNASWFVYNPADLNSGGDCDDFAQNSPGSCSASGWTYSGGGPSAPNVVVVGVSCRPSFSCDPSLALNFTATAKGGALTINASIPASANCPPYAYDNSLIYTLALVDRSACATTLQSNTADLIITLHVTKCG